MTRLLLFAFVIALCVLTATTRAADTATPPLLLIFDSSGSMNEKPQGVPKIQQAKEVVRDLLRDFPEDVPLGLVVYGHRRTRDCSDIELVERIGKSDRARLTRMSEWIMDLTAKGETPIAQTLLDAIPLFDSRPGRIVLITDGREECGGDVCAAAEKLAQAGVALKVDIVGFALNDAQRTSLACITAKTGGHYYDARDAGTLRSAMKSATSDAIGRTRIEVTVTEGAKGKAVSPMIRLRDTSGTETALVDNPAIFRVSAGTYTVAARVGSGAESTPTSATLAEGETRAITIDVGTGTLAVTVTKGSGKTFKQPPVIELRREGQSSPVAGLADSNARFQAQAGNYTVRIGLSSNQTKEFPGITIAAGETTARSVEVPAGEIEITVAGGKYAPRSNPYPYVEIRQGGRMVAALSDNPARFQLLAGTYTVAVTENGRDIVSKETEVMPGGDLSVALQVP